MKAVPHPLMLAINDEVALTRDLAAAGLPAGWPGRATRGDRDADGAVEFVSGDEAFDSSVWSVPLEAAGRRDGTTRRRRTWQRTIPWRRDQ